MRKVTKASVGRCWALIPPLAASVAFGGCSGDGGATAVVPPGELGAGQVPGASVPGVPGATTPGAIAPGTQPAPAIGQTPGATTPGTTTPGATPPSAGGNPTPPAVPGPTPGNTPAPVVVPPTPAPVAGQAPITGREPLAVRLTKQQYSNTIRDLLGLQLTAQDLDPIPADATHEAHFVTWAQGQNFSSDHVVGFSELARYIASQVDAGQIVGQWAGCSDVSAACNTAVNQALSARLFRRPLLADEQSTMEQLFDAVGSFAGASFADAAGAALRAYLQSPQFLYRIETENLGDAGTTRSVTGHELAARLSYFLWQSAPDDSLRAFGEQIAASGNIDEAALEAQVDRMLADPKATRSRAMFWEDYTLASQSAYPAAGDLAADMRRTILATVERIAGATGAGAPLTQLFESKEMVLSGALAEAMGLQSQGPGDNVYDVSNLPHRMGFLTHPGMISAIGTASFVNRGKYLSERVLCYTIAELPDDSGLQQQLTEAAMRTENLSPRQGQEFRYAQGGACLGCHQTFEPIAMAFEQFDVNGFHTTQDAEGHALFTNGHLQSQSGAKIADYATPEELMQLLNSREETAKCLLKNQLSFASGASFAASDDPAVDQAHAAFVAGGRTYAALARAIAVSPQLRTLKVTAAE